MSDNSFAFGDLPVAESNPQDNAPPAVTPRAMFTKAADEAEDSMEALLRAAEEAMGTSPGAQVELTPDLGTLSKSSIDEAMEKLRSSPPAESTGEPEEEIIKYEEPARKVAPTEVLNGPPPLAPATNVPPARRPAPTPAPTPEPAAAAPVAEPSNGAVSSGTKEKTVEELAQEIREQEALKQQQPEPTPAPSPSPEPTAAPSGRGRGKAKSTAELPPGMEDRLARIEESVQELLNRTAVETFGPEHLRQALDFDRAEWRKILVEEWTGILRQSTGAIDKRFAKVEELFDALQIDITAQLKTLRGASSSEGTVDIQPVVDVVNELSQMFAAGFAPVNVAMNSMLNALKGLERGPQDEVIQVTEALKSIAGAVQHQNRLLEDMKNEIGKLKAQQIPLQLANSSLPPLDLNQKQWIKDLLPGVPGYVDETINQILQAWQEEDPHPTPVPTVYQVKEFLSANGYIRDGKISRKYANGFA